MAVQKVNFDDIATSCGNLTNLASSLDTTADEAATQVSKIKDPTWDGEAAQAFAAKLEKLVENLPEANRQLALSVLFLASCADGYEKLGENSVNLLKEIIGGQEYIDNYDVNSAPTPDLSARIADTYGKKPEDTTNTDNGNTNTNDTNNNNSNNTNNSGRNTSGGNNNYSSSGGNNYYTSGGANTYGSAGIAGGLGAGLLTDTTTATEPTDIKSKVTKIDKTTIDKDKLDEKGKALFENDKFKYDEGYAKIGDNYLITCDSSLGKVGDVIKITTKDGKTITCIVAANTDDKNTIKFIIEKEDGFKESEELKDLLANSEKIENVGNCKDQLGIELPTTDVKVGNYDMDNYPTDISNREAALTRGTLVAKYLMENGGFTAEQAAALAGVYVDENGCYPGTIDSAVRQREIQIFGAGYGAGIGSWTTTGVKQTVLSDAGHSTSTPIESLSLKEQCDMIIATSQKSNKKYYDALKRCDNIEDASATAAVMTGGVGFSNSWDTHPTAADAKAMADYYAAANDKTYGYSEYHHNADTRRLATSKEILARLKA